MTNQTSQTAPVSYSTTIGEADEALERQLSDEFDAFNAAATSNIAPSRDLTVRIERDSALVAGVAGWAWGEAADIALTWVQDSERGSGVGAAAITAFEDEGRRRGAQRVFATSFTFQAPSFYKRWDDIPITGPDDVHLRKELVARYEDADMKDDDITFAISPSAAARRYG